MTTHFESREESRNSVPSCTAVVSSQSRTLFTGSICQTLSLFSGVFDGSDDSKHGEEPSPVAPVIIHSPSHRSGIFRHLMGHNLRRGRVGFDSIFLVSTGKVTSFGPHGELNWQVRTFISYDTYYRVNQIVQFVAQHCCCRITVSRITTICQTTFWLRDFVARRRSSLFYRQKYTPISINVDNG